MAREKFITRTVSMTTVDVMQIDVSTAEVTIQSHRIAGFFDDDEKIIKKVSLMNGNDNIKFVKVENVTHDEILYGMTEDDFIKYAKVMPPRPLSQQKKN